MLEERREGGEEVFSPWLWCWRGGEGCIGYGEWVLWRVPEGLSGVEGVGEGKERGPASHPMRRRFLPHSPASVALSQCRGGVKCRGGATL